MRRSLSTITMGMLALLLMLSAPVSAQKLHEKKTGDFKHVERILPRDIIKNNSADKGMMRGKAIVQNAVKPSKYANLLKASKRLNPMAPFGKPYRVAKADGDAIVPPFTEAWDGTYDSLYGILDSNGDGRTWTIGSAVAYYTYSSANTGDDWLISPAFELEGGKLYNFEAMIGAQSATFPERVEILFGAGDDPTAYTVYLLEATDIESSTAQSFAAEVVPEADGEYHIAFHAISDPDQWKLNITGWSLSGAVSAAVPAAVSNLQVAPAAGGALNAAVSFIAPTKTLDGADLEILTKIEILCNGTVAETIDDPEPGSEITVTIEVPESGNYKFDVIPYNEEGAGSTASASAFIGNDKPSYVQNIEGVDNKDGSVTFSWAPYTEETGVNGGSLDLSTLKYNVYSLTEDGYLGDLLTTVTDTIATIDCPNWNTGDFAFFYAVVAPVVSDIEGSFNYGAIIIGEPNELPFIEPITSSGIDHNWWISSVQGEDNWDFSDESTDGDGGSFVYSTSDFGGIAAINTSKITLKGAETPILKFNYALLKGQYGDYGGYSDLYVSIDLQDGSGYNFVFNASTDDEGFQEGTWYDGIVDLSEFANEEYIMVSFIAASNDVSASAYLDNIQIKDMAGVDDLSVKVYAPEKAETGSTIQALALVENEGGQDVEAGSYSVNFYVNGELYETITETEAMEALTGYSIYSVEYPVTLFDKEGVTIKAEVVYENDTDVENNADEAEIAVLVNDLPTVTDLSGVEEDGNVSLTWSAPEAGLATVTADFEDGEDGFSTIDADNDGYGWEFVNNLKSQSGTNAWSSASYVNNVGPLTPDNWLITPRALLTGKFSFYACGQDASWAEEHFAVFVTTGDSLNTQSYTKVSEEFVATGEMTKYTVDLSDYNGVEGYIAIRHFNCTDMFRLNVDDVTYTPVGATELVANGYNVYRDGELIATVEDTEYVDEGVADGEHAYFVSVLYGEQESDLSNEFDITISGGWLPGDVDHDGEVGINDVMAVVAHVLGNTPEVFYPTEANLDGDSEIGINDINEIVKIILDGTQAAPASARTTQDRLVMTSTADGYNINLKASEAYTGCQMTIQLPNSCTLVDAQAANGITVKTNDLGNGTYRLVAYSADGKKINTEDALISLSVNGNCNDNASISQILFTNPAFELVSFAAVESVTGIADVKAQTENAPAYNLQGVKAENLTRGVYVRDGKKFVVK